MKNKILNIAIFTVTCSSLCVLANAVPQHNLLLVNHKYISAKNILPDTSMSISVKKKLLGDDKVSGLDVHVRTINGKVTLSGKVPNEAARQRAISLAREVESVKEVISKIEIDESSYAKNLASDTAITTKIKLKLLDDDQVSGLDIHVRTINGKVTLTGVVPDQEAKDRVAAIAKLTNGVAKVYSKLKLEK